MKLSLINLKLSLINLKLSLINLKLTLINLKLSLINLKLTLINLKLSLINWKLTLINLILSLINLRVKSCSSMLIRVKVIIASAQVSSVHDSINVPTTSKLVGYFCLSHVNSVAKSEWQLLLHHCLQHLIMKRRI